MPPQAGGESRSARTMTNGQDEKQRPGTGSGGQAPRHRTLIEWALSPIAEVHRDEVGRALLMTLLMVLTLAAYYELKTAREAFILSEGGAEVKAYSSAGQALLLLFLVPAYGAFASRVDRGRLIRWVTLFFIACIALFVVAIQAGLRIGIAYFLWVGIFNVMVIAQFWAFANDIFTPEQGKRIFPLVGVGSSLGAYIGSLRAGVIVESGGPTELLIRGGLLLGVCVLVAGVLNRMASGAPARGQKVAAVAEQPLGKEGGFELIRKDRYLMLIALLTVLLNVVNTSGEYLFGRYVVDQANLLHAGNEAARQQFIGETYSHLYKWVNLTGFLLQMFVVSRVFKYLGIGKALFIHPIVALVGYLMMLRAPSLGLMRYLKIADNSLDYSLGSTTKQALWLPTSREAKYKAKQAVDSFFVRAGDVIQAAVVFVGERLAFGVPAFAAANVVLVAAWLGVAAVLNIALRRKAEESHTAAL
jgi:AAA family ATP:ADP antiporter